MSARVHPFELLFGAFRADRFPAIAAALGDNRDVNAFVLAEPALELLRDLRPEDGLGDGVDDFVGLVHAAYLFWRDAEQVVELDEVATRSLSRPRHPIATSFDELATKYVQVAPHIIWGQLEPAASFEPLDGWFAMRQADGTLRMVACFGVHADRPGVSVVAVQGRAPAIERRDDASPLFAPTMPGGDAAHLHAVGGPAELLLLGWRAAGEGGS